MGIEPSKAQSGLGRALFPPIGIWDIVSHPPAIITSDHPARIFAVASAIDWRPEEQNRLIVIPEVGNRQAGAHGDNPAEIHPCSASGKEQPTITSSTSSGLSSGTRARRPFKTWIPISSPLVRQAAPLIPSNRHF